MAKDRANIITLICISLCYLSCYVLDSTNLSTPISSVLATLVLAVFAYPVYQILTDKNNMGVLQYPHLTKVTPSLRNATIESILRGFGWALLAGITILNFLGACKQKEAMQLIYLFLGGYVLVYFAAFITYHAITLTRFNRQKSIGVTTK